MTQERIDLNKRFNYSPPDEARAAVHDHVRGELRKVAEVVEASQPNSREKSLAITHLEEAMFWANAGLARNGMSESIYTHESWQTKDSESSGRAET